MFELHRAAGDVVGHRLRAPVIFSLELSVGRCPIPLRDPLPIHIEHKFSDRAAHRGPRADSAHKECALA